MTATFDVGSHTWTGAHAADKPNGQHSRGIGPRPSGHDRAGREQADLGRRQMLLLGRLGQRRRVLFAVGVRRFAHGGVETVSRTHTHLSATVTNITVVGRRS